MRIYILLFLFSFQWAAAQDGKGPEPAADYKGPCSVTFPKVKVEGNNADVVQKFLTGYIANLRQPGVSIQLSYAKESPGGFHYSFYQTYYGVEVYQSEIKVNTDRHNIVRSVLDNSFNTQGWNVDATAAHSRSVIAMNEAGRVLLAERNIVNHIERVTAGDELVYERDTRSYFAAPDSLVSGKIFNPDPLTSAGQIYTPSPGIYRDTGDTNTVWLNNELKTVNFMANFTGTGFTLENSYIRLADIDSPTVAVATSVVNQFNFNRSQTGFEDVNAFYHLTTYRNYVSSLGYTIADEFVTVDPHAWGVTGAYQDQSSFSPNIGTPQLLYGMGGVDDAEDADVLIHEYGHFLSYNAAPGTNIGAHRNSLDEAFGDYLAASYSNSVTGFNRNWVFNWDGPPWSNNMVGGRTVASSKGYTGTLSGGIYANAPIWSTALMHIHDDIGRTVTDKLIFETHYSYAANIKMDDAARLLIEADTVLNNGAYYCPIYKHLFGQGLLPFNAINPCGFSSINTDESKVFTFLQMGKGFRVVNMPEEKIQVNVLALSGQVVVSFNSNEQLIDYSNQTLPAGVYMVELSNGTAARTFKWCKTF